MNYNQIMLAVGLLVSIGLLSIQKARGGCSDTAYQQYQAQLQSLAVNASTTPNRCEVVLRDSIIPHWYGTAWTFSGHTYKPGCGSIACGYFVSTTLRDLGFNVNRFRLAQQGANEIIKSIAGPDGLHVYRDTSAMIEYLNKTSAEVFVVGLDYHVGYLIKYGNQWQFCHSDYVNGVVVVEDLATSAAFNNTSSWSIGQVFHAHNMTRLKDNVPIKVYLTQAGH